MTTDEGQRIVGIRIPPDQVGPIVRALGAGRDLHEPEEIFTGILDEREEVTLVSGLKLPGKTCNSRKAIPVRYIVVLTEQEGNPHEAALGLTFAYGGSARHVYTIALKGFSVELPEAAAIALSRNPRVRYIEEDGEVSLVATQNNATWGLDRIDQRDR